MPLQKIKVGPIAEALGDQMARIVWDNIKRELILPFLDIELYVFDLGIKNRDYTNDQVTIDFAEAVMKHKAGVKCATITPDDEIMEELDLKQMWKSPNSTIRKIVGGTIFREPILFNNIPQIVKTWKKPIIISRHADVEQCDSTEFVLPAAGKLELVFNGTDGEIFSQKMLECRGASIAVVSYTTDQSITEFAHSSFTYALDRKYSVFLSTANTILQYYDERYRDLFQEVYDSHYRTTFEGMDLFYEHRLIAGMASHVMKSEGGYVWALKNHDGDVESSAIAQGFGSTKLMTSVLVSPDGQTALAEVAHSPMTRLYQLHLKGKETSANPIATIFAWTKCLLHRAKLDQNESLTDFARLLEETCIEIVEAGKVTKDLAICIRGSSNVIRSDYLSTNEFIRLLEKTLREKLESIVQK